MSTPLFWYEQIYGERYKRAEGAGQPTWYKSLQCHTPIPQGWRPPSYSIHGSGAWPDWMASWVPLWSERALDILGPLVQGSCEFIPWVDEPKHRYWLVNVLSLVPQANWSCEQSSCYSGTFASADGIEVFGTAIPPIFRLGGYTGKTFVSDEVARTSVASRLRGVAFVHPSIHWAETVFRSYKFGRSGTGFVSPNSDDSRAVMDA